MLKYLSADTAERTFANGAAAINGALHRQAHISTSSDDTRLDRLVQHLLNLDDDDATELETLGVPAELGSRSPASFNMSCSRSFVNFNWPSYSVPARKANSAEAYVRLLITNG